MRNLVWKHCCFIIASISLLFHCVSSASASEVAEVVGPQLFASKCNILKTESAKQKSTEENAYIIWDPGSDEILGCSNNQDKEKILNEKLYQLSQNPDVSQKMGKLRPIFDDIGTSFNLFFVG